MEDFDFEKDRRRIKRTGCFYGIGSMIFFIIVAAFFVHIIQGINEATHDTKQKYDTLVGRRIIVNKDTSMIVNYSSWNETVTLDNGKEITLSLAEKNLVK